jgi:hypothetical protein
MFRSFYIFLILGCFSISVCKTPVDNFKLSYPHYIKQGSTFQVSIVTSKNYADADELELLLLPGNSIVINTIEIKTAEAVYYPKVLRGINEGKFENAIKCIINLNDDTFSNPEVFFQILIGITSSNKLNSNLNFIGSYNKGDLALGYLESSGDNVQELEPNLYSVKFNFYAPTAIAGDLIKLNTDSHLQIPLKFIYMNQLLCEFWIRFKDPTEYFLTITETQSGREVYKLSVNEFQVLSAESEFYFQKNLVPHFISINSWYHFSILFSAEEGFTSFYCNGVEFSKIELPQFLNVNQFGLNIVNSTEESNFNIDQVRIIDAVGSIAQTFSNRNFKNVILDSAHVLLQLNFSEEELNNLGNNSIISIRNVKIKKSDAPIFTKAPDLNLRALNNYYELEWSGGDYQSAAFYELEKAEGTKEFYKIYETEADNRNKKIYSHLAEKINTSEVVFFRVNQINTDGTYVYSTQVKVGQGLLEDIILGQNYPNPFNPTTKIEFELLQEGEVELKIYNLEGKEVVLLHKGSLAQGVYQFEFDGSDLPSGIYLYKVSTRQFTQTRKMILAK